MKLNLIKTKKIEPLPYLEARKTAKKSGSTGGYLSFLRAKHGKSGHVIPFSMLHFIYNTVKNGGIFSYLPIIGAVREVRK